MRHFREREAPEWSEDVWRFERLLRLLDQALSLQILHERIGRLEIPSERVLDIPGIM